MINYWAVLVSAIAAMVIGSIWWGPLFGKMWIRENGLDKGSPEEQAKMKSGMWMLYVQQLVLSFIQAWVLAYLLNKVGSGSINDGIKYAAIVWAGTFLPVQWGNKLWSTKSYAVTFASLVASLITMVVMGIILAAW